MNPNAVFDETVNPGEQDLRSLITRIPADVDAVVLNLEGDGTYTSFLRQWAEQKRSKIAFFANDSILYEPSRASIGTLGYSITVSTPYFEPAAEAKWKEKYKARYGEEPGALSAAVAYDETSLLLNCMKTDSSVPAVQKCLASTEGYQGVSGKISFGGQQSVTTRNYQLIPF
jgi:ABC-type branched-subunit amino acid transport system substrate-binding protein